MIEIKNVSISKNPCTVGSRITISVELEEFLTYPITYPYGYSRVKEQQGATKSVASGNRSRI